MADTCTYDDAARITIEPAGADDLPVLARLYVQLCTAHGDTGTTAADAAAKLTLSLAAGHRAVLFRQDGQTVGCLYWIDMGDHVFIRNFVLDRAFRGRGLGAYLFGRARREVLPPGRPLRLETSAGAPQTFWEGAGFHVWSVGMRTDPVGAEA